MQPLTLAALARRIGQTAQLVTSEGLLVDVIILHAKQAYGRDRYVVRPVAGDREATVDGSRLTMTEVAS